MAERDDALWRAAVAERQLEILRRRLLNVDPQKRPSYLPGDRLAILQLMWLCGWSIVLTARRFVLHRNTVGSWLRRFRGGGDPEAFFDKPPWNRIGESVCSLVHEMKSLGMDFGTGTRAIAIAIRRLGTKVSRSSVQRFLRFRDWYNTARPNQALGGLTPDEAWSGASLPETTAVRAHDPQPRFEVRRRRYGGDPHLPVLDIEVEWPDPPAGGEAA